jgi:NADPH2:quinone reductase
MLALATVEGPSVVELVEVEEPEPLRGEMLIDVRAVSLNRGEVVTASRHPPGTVIGWDVAGVVVRGPAGGASNEALQTGARVVGLVDSAGWAQRVVLPVRRLAAMPDEMSFAEAAALPMAGLTALRVLEHAGFIVGKAVLVIGAAGGVGRYAVQLASMAGARVTAVTSSPSRARGLTALGATEVVHSIESAVGPFDVVLDGVGGKSLGAAVPQIGDFGVIIAYSSADDGPVVFPTSALRGHPGTRIYSFRIFDELERESSADRDLRRLLRLVSERRLSCEVAVERSWRDAPAVIEALLARRVEGKAVLLVD